MSRTGSRFLLWHEWNPGLDNDQWTLGHVLSTIPGVDAVKIPWIIKVFENPSSPIAFPGAITLARHDALHGLLGRGLMPQDEAFVIGFTMGAASNIKKWHTVCFEWIARRLYRKPYRFSVMDVVAYRLGVWEGQHQECADLQDFPFEEHHEDTLKDLRIKTGVNRQRLYSVYAYEKALIPDAKESKRLDIDLKQFDPSSIQLPVDDGPPENGAP